MDWAVGDVTDPVELAEAAEAETLWVAEDDGRVCGFLLGEAAGSDFHIWEIAVHRDYQRQGIGRKLVETVLDEAARRGFSQATLTTDRTLAWNAPWYRGLGFREIAVGELSPRLAAQLGCETVPQRRCAMARALRPS